VEPEVEGKPEGRRREWKFKWQWDNDTSVGAEECQTKEEVLILLSYFVFYFY